MNPQQLARVALDLISRSSMQVSDDNIAVASQVRAMLHRIANGSLTVTEPVPEDATPAEKPE